jgi:hypothetical protein
MLGEPVRTYRAKVTRSVTIFGLYQPGSRRAFEKGEIIEVTEDSFGNVYSFEDDWATYVGSVVEEILIV